MFGKMSGMGAMIQRELGRFARSLDRRLLLLGAVGIALLLWVTGAYGGFFGSVLLAMVIGIQNLLCLRDAEKANCPRAVVCQYFSVAGTAALSAGCSVLCSVLSAVCTGVLQLWLFQLSLWSAVLIPLLWAGICLPVFYWFGFCRAKAAGMVLVIPVFYLVKLFEDGPGFSALPPDLPLQLPLISAAAAVLFVGSLLLRLLGVRRNAEK